MYSFTSIIILLTLISLFLAPLSFPSSSFAIFLLTFSMTYFCVCVCLRFCVYCKGERFADALGPQIRMDQLG